MKKWITNNLGLKILALLVSVGLWIIAININDPVSENTYTVNVSLQNSCLLFISVNYFEVKDNSDRIKVVVRGTRTALSQFNQADIVATADLSKITEDNLVPIDLSTTKQSDKIEGIRSESQYVKLALEDVRTYSHPLSSWTAMVRTVCSRTEQLRRLPRLVWRWEGSEPELLLLCAKRMTSANISRQA